MGRPDGGTAAQLAFDHRLEAVVAEGALLLDVGADVLEIAIAEYLVE